MRINKEKLYEAFGELIYVVAMADGEIQDTEIVALKKLVSEHLLGADIKWSFDCLLYTSPSPRDATLSRMPSSA